MRLSLLLFVLLLFSSHPAVAHDTVRYRNLVMEGGGIRGIAYGGALQELEERGILPDIIRVGGTSAGAIQATLLAVGYSAEEIIKITRETPLQRFNDGRMFFVGGLVRLRRHYGWYRGERFSEWVGELIEAKTGNAGLTFAQLHALTGTGCYRDLYITGTNLSKQRMEVFSYEQWPDMKIMDAVRISMSIPFYYRAMFIDSAGHVFTRRPKDRKADVMVDGGVLANYPVYLFDEVKYCQPGDTCRDYRFNVQTLGLRLEPSRQIHADANGGGLAGYEISNFKDYMGAFYTLLLESVNRQRIVEGDWGRTISICVDHYGPRVRRLRRKDQETLLQNGRDAVVEFFGTGRASK